jgi:hypothetical protein
MRLAVSGGSTVTKAIAFGRGLIPMANSGSVEYAYSADYVVGLEFRKLIDFVGY